MKKLTPYLLLSACLMLWGCGDNYPFKPEQEKNLFEIKNKSTPNQPVVQLAASKDNQEWKSLNANSNNQLPVYNIDAKKLKKLTKFRLNILIPKDELNYPNLVILNKVAYVYDLADSHLMAVDIQQPSKPKIRWKRKLPTRFSGYNFGGLALMNDQLVVTNYEGFVGVVDLLGNLVQTRQLNQRLISTPSVNGSLIYNLTDNNQVIALDGNLKTVFTYQGTKNPILISDQKKLLVNPAKQQVIASFNSGEVAVLDANTGKLIHKTVLFRAETVNVSDQINQNIAQAMQIGDNLYVSNFFGYFYAYNLTTQTLNWTSLSSVSSTPLVMGQDIFGISSVNNSLVRMNANSGGIVWEKNLENETKRYNLRRRYWVMNPKENNDGDLYYNAPHRRNLGAFWTSPVSNPQGVMTLSNYGTLLTLDPNTGEILNKRELEAPAHSPVNIYNMLIYVDIDGDLVIYGAE